MRFNANEAPEPTPLDTTPLPDGTYRVRVDSANEIDNKAGTGRYLELVLVCQASQYSGRRLWARYTSAHETSERAQTIGLGQISEMSRALGHPVWDHESELVGLVGDCKVGRQKDNAERNEVKGWVVPAETKQAPTYSRPHQQAAANEHDIHRRGGQLREVLAGAPEAPRAPHPADDDFGEVPF